ncbi:MAG: AAA family ATPase [Muribaculaceae bacterium]|nr:AAA family ATPase [Muribaculaceae bacterium]
MIERIFKHLDYQPIRGQILLVNALAAFTENRAPNDVFVLNGYAGTGKTSVIGAYVKALRESGRNVVVLAPTGRAAKVAAQFSGGPASTIHKRIFRQDSNALDPRFFLAPNVDKNTVFIADEASLITDNPRSGESLLKALVRHVYGGEGCNLILVGDTAQLPPVGQPDSPAMNEERLRSIGLNPYTFTLSEPVRQRRESGIIRLASQIRQTGEKFAAGMPAELPAISTEGFDDIKVVSSAELIDFLSDSWNEVGIEETLIVTRSNKRAANFNNAIRGQIMMAEEPLERGDRLVIAKNDYFWSKENKLPQFLANGETVVVDWVGKTEKKYGRYFTDVELSVPSDGSRLAAKIHLRSLVSEGPSIPEEEMRRLYNRVLAEMPGEALSEKIRQAASDPWYNSLQAKYGYCVTCHKAQGGQWKHVYIDLSGIDTSALTEDFYRWFYTAVTRATEKVFLINPTLPVA